MKHYMRSLQVYEGLLYMDFDEGLIKERGYGIYEKMDVDCLPPFWLAYLADPSDSGIYAVAMVTLYQAHHK